MFDSESNGKRKRYLFSTGAKTLITNMALIAALHVNDYKLPKEEINCLGVDLQLSDDNVTRHLSRIGCTGNRFGGSENGSFKDATYELKAPLRINSERSSGKRRGKK